MPTPSRRRSARRRPIRSRCRRRKRVSRRRPEADNLVGIYAALSGRSKADVLERIRRRAVLQLQECAGGTLRRKTVADRLRDEAAGRRPRPCRFHPGRRRRPRPRDRRRNHAGDQGHRRFHPQACLRFGFRASHESDSDACASTRPPPLVEDGCAVAACVGLAQHRDMHDHPATKLRDGSQAKMPCHR